MSYRRFTVRIHEDDIYPTTIALGTCADHAEGYGSTKAAKLVRELRDELFPAKEAPSAIEVLRVLNCMPFHVFVRLMGEDPETNSYQDYWLEKYSDGKGNPFLLLCSLDTPRQDKLWAWAEEEAARQHSAFTASLKKAPK